MLIGEGGIFEVLKTRSLIILFGRYWVSGVSISFLGGLQQKESEAGNREGGNIRNKKAGAFSREKAPAGVRKPWRDPEGDRSTAGRAC